MRETLLIIMLCSLFGPVGCSRRKSPSPADSSTHAEPPRTTDESRSQARAFLDNGKELYRTDHDEKAAEAFQQAIKVNPDLAEAYFRLGLTYDVLGKEREGEESYRKAVEKYKKYLEENREDAEGHYNLGQTYAGLHLYGEAVKEYRQAAHLKTDDADIYYDLGVALMRLAQYDEAASAFSKSLEIDPENYRAEDSLQEAREGIERIKAGKRHQEELLRKQKEEELKKEQEAGTSPEPKGANVSTP